MKRYHIYIYIIVLILLTFIFILHLNKNVIPKKIKAILTETVEKQTPFLVDIKDIRFGIIKGFEIDNIRIYRKDAPNEHILKADKLRFRVIPVPGLGKIHILIPSVGISSADIKIKRDENGIWNFQTPTAPQTEQPKQEKKRFSLAVLGVSLKNGSLAFNDNFKERQTSESLTDIYANIGLSLPNSLTLSLNAKYCQSPVAIKGKISSPLKNQKANLKIVSDLDIKNVKRLKDIGVTEGIAKIKVKVILEPDGTSIIDGVANIQSLKFRKQNLNLDGDFDIDAYIKGNITRPGSFTHKGDITFKKAFVSASKNLPMISNATGRALFADKSITIKDFDGKIADSPVSASGKLDYSGEFPDVNINIRADSVNLGKLINTLPAEMKTKLKDIDIQGKANLNINIASAKDQPQALTYRGDLKITGAALSHPLLKEKLKDLDCDLLFEKDTLTWDKLAFKYQGSEYKSSGTVSEFSNPLISAALESNEFKAKGTVKIQQQENIAQVHQLRLEYKNLLLDIKGAVRDFKNPLVSIEGNIALNLQNLTTYLPKYKDAILNLNPKGIINASFVLSGPIKEITLCNMQANIKSDEIRVKEYSLGNLDCNFEMQDKFLNIPAMAVYPYGGIVNITAGLNLKSQEKPYLINIDAKNIDLGKALLDTEKLPRSKIKGLLALNAKLNGYLDDKNSLKGGGWIQVQDGYLLEFPVVFALMDAILGIPPEYLTLTDAFGNFTVSDRKISTTDFKMLSQQAALLWQGSLGFDGALDFNITGRFAEDVIKKTTAFGKLAAAVLQEAGAYIIEVKLTGTLQKPVYAIMPFPVKKIFDGKVMDKVKDVIGEIEDIFRR